MSDQKVTPISPQRVAAVGAQFTEGQWGRPIYGAPIALACPFCGDVPQIMQTQKAETRDEAWDGGDVFLASCSGCGADGPADGSEIEAAEAWNRRSAGGKAKSKTVTAPPNPMCFADAPDVTLNSAHAMMELICALDCNFGTSQFDPPESIDITLAHMREMVRDAIKFAEEVFCRPTEPRQAAQEVSHG
jgi:Lar family restriction alleviation protein